MTLDRGMGLLQATATNIIGMVGVGPFLTIPFMVTAIGGPHIIYAWAFGAVLALCDGLVYAELGAALPGSGGPYVYLREAYRPFGLDRVMAFLFIFQVLLAAPLTIAAMCPDAGSEKVRAMKSDAIVRVCCASCHGIMPRITVLIAT